MTFAQAVYSDDAVSSDTDYPGSDSTISVRNWRYLRDDRIVKQQFDYSCGASSIATILKEFYKQDVTEKMILDAMALGGLRASFADMANVLPQFGFRAVAYSTSFPQLTKLKIPVVVYLKYRAQDHFSVLRGLDSNTVWLADPSLGNRFFSRQQFTDMWETREDEVEKGKILVILPIGELVSSDDFFNTRPKRTTELAESLQFVSDIFIN